MAVVEKYQAIADRKEARLMAARGVKNTIVAANTARRKGNLEQAVTLYDEALQGLKEHPLGHSNRGYGHIRHIAVEQYVRGQRDALQSVIGKSAKEPSTSLPFPGSPAKA